MSASQIPNLNTLRRGGRRIRRGASDAVESHGSASGKDRVVQGTDNDASGSRLSAVELGYLDDPYARALTPSGCATRRLPIINRGTYARTNAIDRLVARFLDPHSPETQIPKKQIISLGAGSDTRVFRLLSSGRPPDFVYHEIDFSVNTAAKIRAIRSAPLLQRTIGINSANDEVSISEAGDALHSPAYHIHPLDLRSLSPDCPDPLALLEGVEPALPTLLISECCLVYLSPSEADQVVSFFTKSVFGGLGGDSDAQPAPSLTPLGLIFYEPIHPDDPFGRTMVSNLAARGIHLQTLHKYASLEAQRARFRDQGFESGQAAADIDFIWGRWVSEEEKERVAGLEMLDEVEEWQLLARHYCLAWGWRDRDELPAFGGWRGLEAQAGE